MPEHLIGVLLQQFLCSDNQLLLQVDGLPGIDVQRRKQGDDPLGVSGFRIRVTQLPTELAADAGYLLDAVRVVIQYRQGIVFTPKRRGNC